MTKVRSAFFNMNAGILTITDMDGSKIERTREMFEAVRGV